MHGILEEFAEEMGDSLTVGVLDAQQNMNISMSYEIRGTPTMILFKDGEAKWTHVGLIAKDELKQQVSSALA